MKPFESFVATLAPLRAGLLTCLLAMGAGSAAAADNPYNLIEPGVISVGTMGDSKPYTFATADGQFTGFDIELFLNVVSRLGFQKDKVTFTGQNFQHSCRRSQTKGSMLPLQRSEPPKPARRPSTFPTAISPVISRS